MSTLQMPALDRGAENERQHHATRRTQAHLTLLANIFQAPPCVHLHCVCDREIAFPQ